MLVINDQLAVIPYSSMKLTSFCTIYLPFGILICPSLSICLSVLPTIASSRLNPLPKPLSSQQAFPPPPHITTMQSIIYPLGHSPMNTHSSVSPWTSLTSYYPTQCLPFHLLIHLSCSIYPLPSSLSSVFLPPLSPSLCLSPSKQTPSLTPTPHLSYLTEVT